MKSRFSYAVGLILAASAHAAVIPVLALYGVSICPVLGDRGFLFGCRYNAALVVGVALLNLAASCAAFWAFWVFSRYRKDGWRGFRFFPLLSMLGHIAAFATGAWFLNGFFARIEVPGPTIERMNTALFYATILLSVLQASILDWLTHLWLRSHREAVEAVGAASGRERSLASSWLHAQFRGALPLMSAALIGGVFLHAKLGELDELPAGLFREITQVGLFLGSWLALIRLFAFLKERVLVKAVHQHLDALSELRADFRSPTISSGYWESVFHSLNHTSDVLGQRARLIKGFAAYVTDKVVENVLERGHELKPQGELKELAILFSDLRDFTALSNSMPAEKVVRLLNIYFEDMIDVLTLRGVTLDKFIGDGLLAYAETTQAAVEAAHAMLDRLQHTNQKLRAEGLPELRAGIGIHWGSVVLGSIGAPSKMQYTVIGDAVNTAARLEGLCKQFATNIVISEDALKRLDAAAQAPFSDLGAQSVRGLSRSLRLFGLNVSEKTSARSA